MLRTLIVEADVVASTKIHAVEGMLELRVRGIGLGSESLAGKSLKAKYGLGLQRSKPTPGFTPKDGLPIPKGTRMVVAVCKIGTNREPWIMHAWANGEDSSLITGQKLVSQLTKVNKAKNGEDLCNCLFDVLKKGCADETYLDEHFCNGASLRGNNLLQRIVDSNDHSPRLRDLAQNQLQSMKPSWLASQKYRDQALESVRTTQDKKSLILAATILAESIGKQYPIDADGWREGFLKIARQAEERPEEQTQAIIEGVGAAINSESWPPGDGDFQLGLLAMVFEIAAAAKKESVRKAWEDLLVQRTLEGTLVVKEDVLLRLNEIKDPKFRDRLRDAIYTPSHRFGKAPPKPE